MQVAMSVWPISAALMLLVICQQQQHSAGGFPEILEFRSPAESVAFPGSTVELFCRLTGDPFWVINGTLESYDNYAELQNRGFNFTQEPVRQLPNGPEYSRILQIVASLQNNGTNISCRALGNNTRDDSPTVVIVVAGPPLRPSITAMKVLTATTLQLSWQKPFTWPEYEIINYIIIINSTTSHEVVTEVVNATNLVYTLSREGIAPACDQLEFRISASNIVGESDSAKASGGFPIAPGTFLSTTNCHVTFEANGTPSQLEVQFTPSHLCNFQASNYSIIITNTDDSNYEFIMGPISLDSGSDQPVTINAESAGLVAHMNYIATVVVQTLAGNSSDACIFSTDFVPPTTPPSSTSTSSPSSTSSTPSTVTPSGEGLSPTEDDTNNNNFELIIIAATSAGAAVVLCLLLGISFFVSYICYQRQKRRKANARAHHNPPMLVSNPLYSGPIYETIVDTKQFRSLPRHSRAAESCYVDMKSRIYPQGATSGNSEPQMTLAFSDAKPHPYENIELPEVPVAQTPSEDPYTIMDPAGTLTYSIKTNGYPEHKPSLPPNDDDKCVSTD